MPVDTDDLRNAIPSLYPDNLTGEIDAARMRAGQRMVADVIDEAIGKAYSDEAKAWAQAGEGVNPDPEDPDSKSAKVWAGEAEGWAGDIQGQVDIVLALQENDYGSIADAVVLTADYGLITA